MRKKKTVVFLTMLLTALYGMAFPFSGDGAAVKAETAYDNEENGACAGKSDEALMKNTPAKCFRSRGFHISLNRHN